MAIFKWLKGRRKILFCSAFALYFGVGSIDAEQINPKLRPGLKDRQSGQAAAGGPIVQYTAHNRGNIQLAIANNGTFGTLGGATPDPFTGEVIPSCIYPRGSDIVYLWVAAMWIGAIVGRDTLVSVGDEDWYRTREFWPDVAPFGDFQYKSIDIGSPFYDPGARSEDDIICEYADTISDVNVVQMDPFDIRPHKPLNVKVTQRSMAWSYAYADDFILFDYQVENIGEATLREVYMGIYVDGDVWHTSRNGPEGWNDDIVGFYPEHPAPEGCGFIDTINVAYTADNDGDPAGGQWDYRSALGAVGVRVVRTPAEELRYSYNWWIMNYSNPSGDFGPRRQERPGDPFRDMGPRIGTPTGDRNKYYVLRHEEFDYDLLFTAKDHTLEGWLPPPEDAEEYARGFDTRYLLSFGPFNITPGDKLPISFAWVGGTDFHVGANHFEDLFEPDSPELYYKALNFSGLAASSRWASWVYDNPGVDTDSNGYAGKLRTCVLDSALARLDTIPDGDSTIIVQIWEPTQVDSFWYEGDGVPDFRAAGPPPAPRMRLIPAEGRFVVHWNGFYSENTRDIFSDIIDFEGYRIYMGLDDRASSLSLMASYDVEDYNRYVFRQTAPGQYEWVLEEVPYTLDSLKTLFGDPEFDPLAWSPLNPFSWEDEVYYFGPQDFNKSDLTSPHGLRKAYPEATDPGNDASLWREDDITREHGEPLPKFYEYELVIDNLLPTVPYCVAVTCFDFGSPVAGLTALETNPVNNLITEYAQLPADSVEKYRLDAYVYPNPYIIDDDYAAQGFENRNRTLAEERARRIHFANLPNVCTIKIFSLDGDLVRELDHNYPGGGPTAMHETWDLITRNTQAVVSGIYYYVIESEERTQIGKLVIIK